jgi:DNA polymerase-3 subunit epsilon
MEFVAIDVETANADMAPICQIGIARFVNGILADEWKSYVDPMDDFDPMNVSIRGIDESTVEGAPTFGLLANSINDVLDGRVVVAHTAFDKVAIYQAGTSVLSLTVDSQIGAGVRVCADEQDRTDHDCRSGP